ncbi:proprotein convertase P-domain-containing protein [Verrucomicrobiaceae bacterium 227]
MNYFSLSFLLVFGASAQAATIQMVSSPNLPIPDNNMVGVASFMEVATGITSIDSVVVTLEIDGGYNGDYYSYLQHSSGFAVLLNRVGRTTTSVTDELGLGYSDSGLDLTFSDAAADGDVHVYRAVSHPMGGQITGEFQPDGRDINPALSVESTPRTAMLSSFNGLDPNGIWVLYVNDNSAGSVGTFVNWGLTISGTIPEPSTMALLLLGGVSVFRRRR